MVAVRRAAAGTDEAIEVDVETVMGFFWLLLQMPVAAAFGAASGIALRVPGDVVTRAAASAAMDDPCDGDETRAEAAA